MKNNKFTSGNEYCLRELFGNNTKIIIPDLQRDYCWGDNAYVVSSDKKPRELVSGFINNIVELYNEIKNSRQHLALSMAMNSHTNISRYVMVSNALPLFFYYLATST